MASEEILKKQGWVNVININQTQDDVDKERAHLKECLDIRNQCMDALKKGRPYTVNWLNSIPEESREKYRAALNLIQQLNREDRARRGKPRRI